MNTLIILALAVGISALFSGSGNAGRRPQPIKRAVQAGRTRGR